MYLYIHLNALIKKLLSAQLWSLLFSDQSLLDKNNLLQFGVKQTIKNYFRLRLFKAGFPKVGHDRYSGGHEQQKVRGGP